jgi:hypothetical protein
MMMTCVGNVARRYEKYKYEIQTENLQKREHFMKTGIKEMRADLFGSGHDPGSISCQHGNEYSSSIKDGEFLDELRGCWLL